MRPPETRLKPAGTAFGGPFFNFSAEQAGLLYGFLAYTIWGILPIYWKSLAIVPPVQLVCHRIVWACLLSCVAVLASGRGRRLQVVLGNWKQTLSILGAGVLISFNWGLYIWAVNDGRLLESSLGYYLNPLMSAAIGALILKERLDTGSRLAYGIAGLGIVVQAVFVGTLPWVSLALALSFAVYGLVKKVAGLDSLTGLFLETAVVTPFAVAFLLVEEGQGRGAFGHVGWIESVMLVGAGLVTAIPLIMFASGVKRLPLYKMGFLQYISPTFQMLLGVLVYHEEMSPVRAIVFGCVMSALLVFGLTRRKAGVL